MIRVIPYQRLSSALESNQSKLAMLQQQYDNIQREMKETGAYSSDLANKLLSKQRQIDKTNSSIQNQTQKLKEMESALKGAKVNTNDLDGASARLGAEMEELKSQQEAAVEGAIFETDQLITAGDQIVMAGDRVRPVEELQ